MKCRFLHVAIALGITIPFSFLGTALSYEKTHCYITEQAFKVWPNDQDHEIYQYLRPTEAQQLLNLRQDYQPIGSEEDGSTILEGVVEEDFGDRGFPLTNWMDHSWNPETNQVWTLADPTLHPLTAIEKAIWMFAEAVSRYGENKPLAYWYLGRAVHCLQDMSVPAHTHCDVHMGIAIYAQLKDAYEYWTDNGFADADFTSAWMGGGRCSNWDGNYVNSNLGGLPELGNSDEYSEPSDFQEYPPSCENYIIRKLLFNLAQASQYFPSNDVASDIAAAPLFASGWPAFRPRDLANFLLTYWLINRKLPITYPLRINQATMPAMGERLVARAIQFNADLYRLFWESVNLQPVSVTTTSLPDGTVGDDYFAAMEATGGLPTYVPYTWEITEGSLPDRMLLDSSTGEISGTPSAEGTYTFTARVTSGCPGIPGADKELSIIIEGGYEPLRPIPDTGITQCYDYLLAIECPSPGQPYYGQDAQYVTNPMSYTVSPDGLTVTDNVTGLMWQREDDNQTRNWESALAYCEDLDLGGHTDWRLPNEYELQSIVDYGTYNPAIDMTVFPGARAAYWSSTTFAYKALHAWYVDFSKGWVYAADKLALTLTSYVRCARGEETHPSSFTDNLDRTVTDNVTGLMWQQVHAVGGYDWESALDYCEDLNLAGHTDWRLPDIKELRSIVDNTRYGPAIDPEYFSTDSYIYWSSSS